MGYCTENYQPLYTAPLPDEFDVYSSKKIEVEYSKEKFREGKFSILTTFLTILGVGVDPVYIITNLKTVYGTQVKSHILRSYGSTAAIATDKGKTEIKRGTAFGGSSDFMLAFRVCKVRVVRKTRVVDE
ncbi:hypothetical protein QBC32DRAFT_401594 [Pseudoneurospora amorphoporcata]|uniref:Uncharacterized protein n=1 Tax=Pseudoneurospora amorphoporcata TaxID=241081 RepID=A0AAN6SBU6_9PEZI|nr:hypothetical protein QBC32DRAFT_401594 [Pseudoneurospora amorphoporcata]